MTFLLPKRAARLLPLPFLSCSLPVPHRRKRPGERRHVDGYLDSFECKDARNLIL